MPFHFLTENECCIQLSAPDERQLLNYPINFWGQFLGVRRTWGRISTYLRSQNCDNVMSRLCHISTPTLCGLFQGWDLSWTGYSIERNVYSNSASDEASLETERCGGSPFFRLCIAHLPPLVVTWQKEGSPPMSAIAIPSGVLIHVLPGPKWLFWLQFPKYSKVNHMKWSFLEVEMVG